MKKEKKKTEADVSEWSWRWGGKDLYNKFITYFISLVEPGSERHFLFDWSFFSEILASMR